MFESFFLRNSLTRKHILRSLGDDLTGSASSFRTQTALVAGKYLLEIVKNNQDM